MSCRDLKKEQELEDLGRWVDAHCLTEMLIQEDDGRLRPITNVEMFAWIRWKKSQRITAAAAVTGDGR